MRYLKKDYSINVRVDALTYEVIRELMKHMGTRRCSEAVRCAIWFLAAVASPSVTVKKAFKREALDKIAAGGDPPLAECFRPFREIIDEIYREWAEQL